MHNLKPKKYLGQHFLTDQQIASRIVHTLEAGPEKMVIEIGPGEGVLTHMLVDRYEQLTVLEVDPDAVTYLHQRFAKARVHIRQVDVLKWPIGDELQTPAHFIGNLPYNISSPIFFQLLEHRDKVAEGVFMIQKEVGLRICAPKGNKTYGILSVLLGAYFDLEYKFSVPPTVFRPPPKVDSAVIRLSRKANPPTIAFKTLKRVVKLAFNQRRKTLRNALKSLNLPDFEGKEEMMKLRAEQLGVEEFVHLAQLIS
ncbi:MAG: 16S rRNA (adenine(1518)-N(6)/adenine(1519)-N(6))-dimethyltransferase RsmA [Bacteroidota bacterium]